MVLPSFIHAGCFELESIVNETPKTSYRTPGYDVNLDERVDG
jgi:hypothetical protein